SRCGRSGRAENFRQPPAEVPMMIVLTGASRGIGAHIARDLAKDGHHLVLTARDAANLEAVGADVLTAGGKATLVVADIAVAADRERILSAAREIGPVDVLINNAALEV